MAADVVIVDVGPSDDAINCNIVMSCDVVQPSARPDTFSWTSILRLLLNFLPRWMKLWRVVQQQASKQLDAMTTLAPQFPYLFPTIVGQFLTDKGRDVVMTRSHASIVHGMTRSIKLAVYLSFELARDGYTDKHMLELAQDLKLLSEEAAAEEEAAEEETEAEEAEEEAAEEAEEEADTEDEGDDDASEKVRRAGARAVGT